MQWLSGDEKRSPEEIPEETHASVQVVGLALPIVNATGEVGTRADYNVDGGWLKIDEGTSTVCMGMGYFLNISPARAVTQYSLPSTLSAVSSASYPLYVLF